MLFLLYQICVFISLRVSLKRAYQIAQILGKAYSFFSFRDKTALCTNLAVIFPHRSKKEISSIAEGVFMNFCKYLVDFFRLPLVDDDYIKKNIKIEGIEYLDDSLKQGRGVILVSAHLGNWELGGSILAKLGYNVSAVALSHRHKKIDNFFTSRRQMFGMQQIPFGGALRRCFKCLSDKNILGLIGDRDYFDNGVHVHFFSKKTLMPKGPAVLALRFGSPIVPIFIIRNADDTFTIKFYPPIKYRPTGDKDKDIKLLTLSYLKIIEDVVRKHPEQWYVFRKFWERISWKPR